MDDYRVQLDVFTGPLDLLLYLIKRDELDIQDIPIARITDQYLEYVRMLEQLDPNAAGDFLVMASTLIEIKSRVLLPTPPIEIHDDGPSDPRATLVEQLLEYKRIKDAARALDEAAREQRRRFVRAPAELPAELRGVELEEAEVWDLLSAFQRVMESISAPPPTHDVRLDETPIAVYENRILGRLHERGAITFEQLFDGAADRATVVGLFLALLELIRKQRVRAEQERIGGTIYLFLLVEVADDAPAAGPAATSPEPSGDTQESSDEPTE